jgi:hypothetical protein
VFFAAMRRCHRQFEWTTSRYFRDTSLKYLLTFDRFAPCNRKKGMIHQAHISFHFGFQMNCAPASWKTFNVNRRNG